MRKILVFVMFLLFFSTVEAQKYTIGVSPSFIDLGTLQRGESKIVKFYVVSPSNEEILVSMKEEPGNPDFLIPKYSDRLANFSEEDASKWIVYFSNPIVLKPQETPLETQVGKIRTWREVSLMIKVPLNAEPGYHLVSVEPRPQVSQQPGGQIGIGLISLAKVNIFFKIDGTAVRDGEIVEILTEGNKVKVYFKNKGTVTMRVRSYGQIFFENSSISFSTSSIDLKPNELGELIGYIDQPIKGEYEGRVVVDFLSGEKEKTTTLIFDYLPEKKVEEINLLPLLLFLVLIIASVIVWRYFV